MEGGRGSLERVRSPPPSPPATATTCDVVGHDGLERVCVSSADGTACDSTSTALDYPPKLKTRKKHGAPGPCEDDVNVQ